MSIKYIYIAIIALSLVFTGCGNSRADLGHHHSHEHSDAHEAAEGHHHDEDEDEHGGDEIVLEPEDAVRFGVTTQTAKSQQFSNVITVSGSIEDASGSAATISATASGIVTIQPSVVAGADIKAGQLVATVKSNGVSGGDANRVAKVALDAAREELERLRPLHEEGIVTTKEFNAARQAYETARAQYSSQAASGRITSPISGVVTNVIASTGSYVEVGQPIAEVSGSGKLMLRADVPSKYASLLPSIVTANFRTSDSQEWVSLADIGGVRTSFAAKYNAQKSGYVPIYFSFNNKVGAVNGTFAEIKLIGQGGKEQIVVPRSAISEQQGLYFVYVQVDDHGYEKREVKLGESDGVNIAIESGLEEGDNVVVTGVTFVKLAETSGNIPEGHSHNH